MAATGQLLLVELNTNVEDEHVVDAKFHKSTARNVAVLATDKMHYEVFIFRDVTLRLIPGERIPLLENLTVAQIVNKRPEFPEELAIYPCSDPDESSSDPL